MTALAATSLTLMSCSRFAARSAPARAIHTRIAPPTPPSQGYDVAGKGDGYTYARGEAWG